MKLKKVSSMILAVTLACTMTVTPVLADEVSDLKQKKQETQNQVSDLQTQLNSLMTKISDLENDLIETGEEISQTEEDLKTAQEEQEQQYAAMKLRIKYMYEEGTGTATVEKVLTSGDISSVLTQAEYSQQVHSYDRDKLEEYVATVQKVEDLKTTLETKMADLQETQTEYDAQKDELNTTITEKSSEIANLDVKIDEAVKKAAEEAAKKAAEEQRRKQQKKQQRRKLLRKQLRRITQAVVHLIEITQAIVLPVVQAPVVEPAAQAQEAQAAQAPVAQAVVLPAVQAQAVQVLPHQAQVIVLDKGSIIVNAAYSQIGVPYVWGGTTPGVGLDCSGLVQYCYRQAGISIPRTSGDILAAGTIVSDPQPGDICWTSGHVAIYIGGGQMIEAQQTGVPVKVSSVRVTYYVRY